VSNEATSILYRADTARGPAWAKIFTEHAPDLDFRVWPDAGNLADVGYLIAWRPPAGFLAGLPNLKVLFSSGAGVDHIDWAAVPPHVQVVRMVDAGIVSGMIEYVTMSVLVLHRNLLDYLRAQSAAAWRPREVLPASARTIGVMGLGVLGSAVLDRLRSFGFELRGWNRSRKSVPGVRCYSGAASLGDFLERCNILVCLLPLTNATRGILDQRVFSALPPGAAVINVGRGAQLDERALLDALDSGQLSTAILDVFEPEPLPATHPFWTHPRIVMTPHIASVTHAETAAPVVLENLRRHLGGQPMHDVIDRRKGY
jgi:glyoxylate/hydroxypyruvate reductase A